LPAQSVPDRFPPPSGSARVLQTYPSLTGRTSWFFLSIVDPFDPLPAPTLNSFHSISDVCPPSQLLSIEGPLLRSPDQAIFLVEAFPTDRLPPFNISDEPQAAFAPLNNPLFGAQFAAAIFRCIQLFLKDEKFRLLSFLTLWPFEPHKV